MGGLCSKDEDTARKSKNKRSRYAAKADDEEIPKRGARHVAEEEAPPSAGAAAGAVAPATAKNKDGVLTYPDPCMVREELIHKDFKQFKNLVKRGEQALCVAKGSKEGTLIVGGEDCSLHMVRPDDGKVIRTWKKAHTKDINRVTNPHPSTDLFFTCSRDTTVKAWSGTGEDEGPRCEFAGHSLNVTTVTSSPQGNQMVSGSRDNSVRLWDVETQQCTSTQDIKLNIVHFCRWIPALQMVAQGGEDLTVRLWDTREKEGTQLTLEDTLANFDYHPICSALVGHEHASVSLYTGHNGFNGQGAMITEWDLRMKKQVRHFRGHRGTVRWVREVAGQDKLLSCSDDGTIRLWNLKDGSLDAEISFPEGVATCCDALDDENTYAFSCRTGVVVCGQFTDYWDNLTRTRYFGAAGEY